ncbi:MAG TPA: dihydrofolate reductase family protein, partial [Solirubrobacteraceae bacterium]|nr:dihydrofolate reductase family protein [Solirubrobacteraceae bacterium]
MILHRVLPEDARLTPEDLLAEVAPRERAPDDRPLVMIVMVATVDGRAAVGGSSRALGGDADLALLLELRTIADAVLVGGATVRAEGYGRLVGSEERRGRRRAAGLAEDPGVVLVSRSMNLPWDAGLFAVPDQPVLVYTDAGAGAPPDVAAPVELVRLEEASLAAAMADLHRRGVRSLLCEGGPTLNRALLAAGVVD